MFLVIFLQKQKFFLSVFPKRIYQVPLRLYSKSSQKEPAKHKKTSGDKISKEVRLIFLKKTCKGKREVLGSGNVLQLKKVFNPPVIKLLS